CVTYSHRCRWRFRPESVGTRIPALKLGVFWSGDAKLASPTSPESLKGKVLFLMCAQAHQDGRGTLARTHIRKKFCDLLYLSRFKEKIMPCLNLQQLFGNRCRITFDRDSAESSRDRDPWLQQIRCRRGLIYPYSATHLAVQVDYHPFVAQRLVRMGFKLIQDG